MFTNGKFLILVLVFVASSLAVWAWVANTRTRAERLHIASPSSVSTTQDRAPMQVVRFDLYDAGILPREARVAPGRVVIAITDFTGGTGGLVVQRELSRTDVGQVRRTGERWRGRQELILGAGTYDVFDASRPENRATLIVAPSD